MATICRQKQTHFHSYRNPYALSRIHFGDLWLQITFLHMKMKFKCMQNGNVSVCNVRNEFSILWWRVGSVSLAQSSFIVPVGRKLTSHAINFLLTYQRRHSRFGFDVPNRVTILIVSHRNDPTVRHSMGHRKRNCEFWSTIMSGILHTRKTVEWQDERECRVCRALVCPHLQTTEYIQNRFTRRHLESIHFRWTFIALQNELLWLDIKRRKRTLVALLAPHNQSQRRRND